MLKQIFIYLFIVLGISTYAQHVHTDSSAAHNMSTIETEPQPLLAQAIRLQEALFFLGSSLSVQDEKRLRGLQQQPLSAQTTKLIQEILDPYCIAIININPEARVKVQRGFAKAKLIQSGWVSFLVKVI